MNVFIKISLSDYQVIGICDDYFLELPKGSIEKLTGRNLFWSDEPVEV